ncbi:MAG: MBL fold metallo-hydrolase [Thermoplasmata archaeon]
MNIRWHGHSCFEISDEITVITDPHDGKSLGLLPPLLSGDVVLVSHDHFDHSCTRMVKGNYKLISRPGVSRYEDIKFYGIASYHDDKEGIKRGENIIFKFNLGGLDIVHLGDLGCYPAGKVLSQLENTDIMFVPAGNVFTMSLPDAWKLIEAVKPKIVIPMHYRVGGLSMSIRPVDPDFLEMKPKEMEVVRVGNQVEIYPDDLTEQQQQLWIFSL